MLKESFDAFGFRDFHVLWEPPGAGGPAAGAERDRPVRRHRVAAPARHQACDGRRRRRGPARGRGPQAAVRRDQAPGPPRPHVRGRRRAVPGPGRDQLPDVRRDEPEPRAAAARRRGAPVRPERPRRGRPGGPDDRGEPALPRQPAERDRRPGHERRVPDRAAARAAGVRAPADAAGLRRRLLGAAGPERGPEGHA